MLRGLWKLTWIELKIFLREPLGAFGTIGIPVLVFIVTGRIVGHSLAPASLAASSFISAGLPVLASVLIAISAVLSLVTIISIYREGGILKRLRATPLRPQTILTAHVVVKLLLTAATLALMVIAGKRYYPVGIHVPLFGFTMALLISTCSILSIGFLIASIVPTARQSCAANIHRVTARRHLEGRRLVGARGRCSGTGGGVYRVHCALGEGVSLGVATLTSPPTHPSRDNSDTLAAGIAAADAPSIAASRPRLPYRVARCVPGDRRRGRRGRRRAVPGSH
jgi:hypothetical protein